MSEPIAFDFSKRFSPKRKKEFAQILLDLHKKMGMKVSSRGWAYILEGERYINKDQFDRVQDAINDLRRTGDLPVDFVQEDGARDFEHLNNPYEPTMPNLISQHIQRVTEGFDWVTPDHWREQGVFIQVIVEKVDLITLFEPLCRELSIPIANARGWSSIHQRATYARRFKEAEEEGKQCILLYCGDHDPDGLRISDTARKNLEQVQNITWYDGKTGYDPANLIIDRFGLEYKFIKKHNLTWIDNLITGSSKNLADPKHPNYGLPYVQQYLKQIGERKCEANALIVIPQIARQLFFDAVNKHVDITNMRQHIAELNAAAEEEYNEALDTLTVNVEDIVEYDENSNDKLIKVRAFIDAAVEQL